MKHPSKPLCASIALAATLASLPLASCADSEPAAQAPWSAAELDLIASLSPLPELPASPSNRYADDPRAAHLGERIFFDAAFSLDGSIACATCHKPALYFTDGQPLAVGLFKLARHTPTVVGAAWSPFQFWDGRKDSLWSQALAPFEGAGEMGTNRMRVVRRLLEVYGEPYRELFGEPPALDPERFPPDAMPMPDDPEHPWARAWARMGASERTTVDALFARVGKAIAAYERRLLPPEADFDRYARALAAGDPTGGGHLSAAARRGLRAFIGRAGCIHCHNGPLFTDFAFHNVGLAPTPGEARPDLGRAGGVAPLLDDRFNSAGPHSDSPALDDLTYLNPEFEDFRGAFKTPGLRNVAASAPYGHNGQFAELAEVLEWYAELPLVPLVGHRDLLLRVLPRDVDQADLVAFLEAL